MITSIAAFRGLFEKEKKYSAHTVAVMWRCERFSTIYQICFDQSTIDHANYHKLEWIVSLVDAGVANVSVIEK
jgi:hypothetical protein